MLQYSPKERISAEEALHHPYFHELIKTSSKMSRREVSPELVLAKSPKQLDHKKMFSREDIKRMLKNNQTQPREQDSRLLQRIGQKLEQ